MDHTRINFNSHNFEIDLSFTNHPTNFTSTPIVRSLNAINVQRKELFSSSLAPCENKKWLCSSSPLSKYRVLCLFYVLLRLNT